MYAYAESAALAGARYAVITMMQGTKFMLAPNAVYDTFTGYAPGDACATRDLVLDLYAALAPRGIRLMLYWTGDGPHMDQQAISGLGWPEATTSRADVPELFAQRWGAVLQEYAERYGDKVAGWWVDGCYTYFNYTDAKLQPYHDGACAMCACVCSLKWAPTPHTPLGLSARSHPRGQQRGARRP